MTMITMYDSVNSSKIPADAEMASGYIDGQWPSWFAIRDRFKHLSPHHTPTIATSPHHDADVLDVENGDATPADVPAWCERQRKIKPGQIPVVYTSRSMVPAVRAALVAAKVAEPQWWVADWTNVPHLVPGSHATQWTSDTTAGYDISLVSPDFATLVVHAVTHPKKPIQDKPVVVTVPPTPLHIPIQVTNATPKGPVTMPSLSTLEVWVRKAGSYAVIINNFTNTAHLPNNVKVALTAVAGFILSVDHYTTTK